MLNADDLADPPMDPRSRHGSPECRFERIAVCRESLDALLLPVLTEVVLPFLFTYVHPRDAVYNTAIHKKYKRTRRIVMQTHPGKVPRAIQVEFIPMFFCDPTCKTRCITLGTVARHRDFCVFLFADGSPYMFNQLEHVAVVCGGTLEISESDNSEFMPSCTPVMDSIRNFQTNNYPPWVYLVDDIKLPSNKLYTRDDLPRIELSTDEDILISTLSDEDRKPQDPRPPKRTKV